MYKRVLVFFLVVISFLSPSLANASQKGPVFLCCSAENDLYKVLSRNGIAVERFESSLEAVSKVSKGGGVMILAEGYPRKVTEVESSVFALAKRKNVRLYVEYPGFLPGMKVGPAKKVEIERAVIAGDFFGSHLGRMRIMAINAKQFVTVDAKNPYIVFARVAGFDTAVYGLPEKTWPALFEHEDGGILVCTAKLSNFVTARFAPKDAIVIMWQKIFEWVVPGWKGQKLDWTEAVRPSYSKSEPIAQDIERKAFERGVEWYENSGMLISKEMDKKIIESVKKRTSGRFPPPSADETLGDGSYGIMQSYNSGIGLDGKQFRSVVRRGDNQCETAMTYAIGGKYIGGDRYTKVAGNILDYYLFDSQARKGGRGDPEHGAYGMIAWGVDDPAWLVANYGDDNARQMMGIMATAAVTGEDRWDEALALCMLANIRTTARTGFRADRLDMGPLTNNGWLHYFNANTVRLSPHFEAYLWACFLWAYEHTGDELLYERTIRAIRKTMQNYPDGWRWTNGLAQEKARMLLPLAWLVRVKDTPEHRGWLRQVAEGLISLQDECGAIREELGKAGMGAYPPPPSNESYGGHEASLIQKNGDPVADLLYTTNFAFLGLHEAAAATGDEFYIEAEDKLAEFLCRIQVRSEKHPEFDGAWFRGFDFQRWQYWASDADAGWGAWCAITGWTHPWITSVLALRQEGTSFWDMTADPTFVDEYKKLRPVMLPEDKINAARTSAKVKKSLADINVITPLDHRYSGISGHLTLIDGDLAGVVHSSGDWLGFEGKDFEAIVDLGQITSVKRIEVQFLHLPSSGIFLPRSVEFAFSSDGTNFGSSAQAGHDVSDRHGGALVTVVCAEGVKAPSQFIRIKAKAIGKIPQWHHARGRDGWLFVGEIMVNRTKQERVSIIPYPWKVEFGKGEFNLNSGTKLFVDEQNNQTGLYLAEMLSAKSGISFKLNHIKPGKTQDNSIVLEIDPSLESLGKEGYKLEVDGKVVRIASQTSTGVFYGCQSLLQLLPAEVFDSSRDKKINRTVPALTIEDKPRFGWRGLLLDCSRTFWGKDFVKRYIDLLALHKMNRLHLHLTDDQGWRVESESWSKLNSIGSQFSPKYSDKGGYYSKEDIREIVAYGESRNVTIVPEIEMPGHTLAALASYPELSCTGGPFEIYPFFKGPGIQDNILCAGNEKVFVFIEDVLREVAELFPSEYIHIGGDEARKDKWKACAKCQSRMKQLGLKNEGELQSYFVKRVEKILTKLGKRLIGWDEILEGGLAPNASVMSWRGTAGGIEAASHGHDVVMSPYSHCYLDYTYQTISTSKIYSFEPTPAKLTAEQSRHILGAQANMWTHIARTPEAVDAQVFPRLSALAEVVWSSKQNRDFESFSERLDDHKKRLDYLGVEYYRLPEDLKTWGKIVGNWKAEQVSPKPVILEFDISESIDSGGLYEVMALYTYGAHAAIIEWIALTENGKEIHRDTHEAWSGAEKRNIFYKLKVGDFKPTAKYELRMKIYVPDNGTDSNGQVGIKESTDD